MSQNDILRCLNEANDYLVRAQSYLKDCRVFLEYAHKAVKDSVDIHSPKEEVVPENVSDMRIG